MDKGFRFRICLVAFFFCICQTFLYNPQIASASDKVLDEYFKRLHERLEFCNRLIARNPKNAQYYLLRSLNQRDEGARRADVIRSIRLDNRIAEARFENGSSDGNFAVASRALKAALKLNPNYFKANYRLGQISIGEEPLKAVRYLTRALEIDPYNHVIYSYRTEAYYYAHDLKNAYIDYERATRRTLWTDSAGTYDWTHEFGEDMISYGRVHSNFLNFDPDGLSVLYEVEKTDEGPYSYSHETLMRVVDCLSDTIRRNPWDNEAIFIRAQALYLDYQLDKALADLDHILKADGPTIAACRLRALVSMEQNNYRAALADLNHSIEMSPDTSIFYLARARCYFHLGEKKNYENDVINCYVRDTDFTLAEVRHEATTKQCFRPKMCLVRAQDRF